MLCPAALAALQVEHACGKGWLALQVVHDCRGFLLLLKVAVQEVGVVQDQGVVQTGAVQVEEQAEVQTVQPGTAVQYLLT